MHATRHFTAHFGMAIYARLMRTFDTTSTPATYGYRRAHFDARYAATAIYAHIIYSLFMPG